MQCDIKVDLLLKMYQHLKQKNKEEKEKKTKEKRKEIKKM